MAEIAANHKTETTLHNQSQEARPGFAKRFWPLLAILAVFAASVDLEIQWGLPGEQRVHLLLPHGLSDGVLKELTDRSAEKLRGRANELSAIQGDLAPATSFDRGEALDAVRRFLLYSDQPDEMRPLMGLSHMRPAKLEFDPHLGHHGGGFLYPLGAWLKLASLAGFVHEGSMEFYLQHPDEFARVYVAGRVFVALCVAAAVGVVYLIGLRLGGPPAAALAAGLTAWCPATLAWSVVLNPHAPAMFMGMLAVYGVVVYCETPRGRTLILAALAAGVAIGTSAVSLPLMLPVLLAPWLMKSPTGSCWWRTVTSCGAAVAAFLAVNPYTILAFRDRLGEARSLSMFFGGGFTLAGPVDFLAGPMRESLGTFFLVATLAAMVVLLWRQPRRALLLAAPLVLWLAIMPTLLGEWAAVPQYARFILPELPLAALLIGWALAELGPRARRFVPALLAAMLAIAAPTVYVHARSAAGENPRLEAGDWLRVNASDRPLVVARQPTPFRCPVIPFLEREVRYAPPPGRPYVAIWASWRPVAERPGRYVFQLGARPEWLRVPMSYADHAIVVDVHAAGEAQWPDARLLQSTSPAAGNAGN